MKRMLFNATQAEELRVAIVDGQNLLDLDIETLGKEQRKGNIYKGVITRIEPSLEACFVDYGTDRHGFLPFKEVSRSYFQDYDGGRARIQDVLREGMEVIVQVEKDERGNKGAALTTFISLAGRYLVLMPNNPRGGGVSRRIEGEERQELKAAMAELDVPRGMSLIARTAGIGRSVEELQWDFNYLQQLWQAIEEAGNAHNEPYLLFMESSLVIRAIRDYYRPDIGEILIDNQDVFEQVQEFMSYVMPNNVGKLKHYDDHTPLFSRFQIEHQIESAFSRSVSLPSGGAIVIDHTEALVSVDVNSARSTRGADIEDTAFKTNMEAAEEVARQMRLRDLGGLVVIDFIDMENTKHQRDVENTLRDALKKDRARVQMGKLSRFGLLELSRQRLQPSLGESSHVACPRCAGTGVIRGIESTALHVLRIIQEEAMKDNTGEVHAQVPVDVATFLLNEKRAELFGLEERLDVSVFLIPNIHLENPHYEITRVRTDGMDDNAEPSYKRVAEPEKEESAAFGSEKAKVARPEPAVKGIKHTQPAPVFEQPKQASWWDNLKAWFGKLFSASPETKAEAAPAPRAQSEDTHRRSNKRAQQQRRQTPRRQNNRNEDGENGSEESSSGGSNNNRNRNERRNNQGGNQGESRNRNSRQRNNEEQRQHNAVSEAAAPQAEAQTPAVAEARADNRRDERNEQNNERRRNRNERQPRNAAPEAATPVAAEQAPLVVQLAEAPAENKEQQGSNNRRNRNDRNERSGRNQRDRRNQNGKKRNIPSAVKIEQYLMIGEAADIVRDAVAHVMGEPKAEAVQVNVSAAVAPQAAPAPVAAHNTEVMQDDTVAAAAALVTAAVASITSTAAEPSGLFAIEDEDEELRAHDISEPDASLSNVLGGIEHERNGEKVQAAVAVVAASDANFDLGGLVLVQTDPQALAAAAQVQPELIPALRRADAPPIVETITDDAPLVQVETAKN